jgi:hypothetical protein
MSDSKLGSIGYIALQLLGVRGWRRRAENRDEWRHALREAKARKGCSAIHGWMDWIHIDIIIYN